MLNEKQQNAYDGVIGSEPGTIATLRGSAGTGKTFTAAEIIKGHLADISLMDVFKKELFVKIIAPTAAAKSVIQRKTFESLMDEDGNYTISKKHFNFSTLASFAKDVTKVVHLNEMRFYVGTQDEVEEFREKADKMGLTKVNDDIFYERTVYKDGELEEQTFISEQNLKQAAYDRFKWDNVSIETEFPLKQPIDIAGSLKDVTLLIIDEATMVTQEESEVIDEAVCLMAERPKEYKMPPIVMYVGDKKQIPPVEGRINDHMNLTNQGENIYELTEDKRATNELTRVSKMIGGGQIFKNLTFLPQIVSSNESSISELIDNHSDTFKDSDVVIAHEVDIVGKLNNKIRQVKGFTDSEWIESGETLTVRKNVSGYEGLSNGDNVQIEKVFGLDEFRDYAKENLTCVDPMNAVAVKHFEQALRTLNSVVSLGEMMFAEISVMDGQKTEMAFIENPLKNTHKAHMNDLEQEIKTTFKMIKESVPVVRAVLGYSRTIHTAQGSEWDNVVVIVRDKGYRLPNESNLEYVAGTRAKNKMTGFVTKNIKTQKEINRMNKGKGKKGW